MNLILFGFKGCGKSTFGKLLAEKVESPFLDTDRMLEERYAEEEGEKLSAREIYRKLGEEAFRELETRVVEEVAEKKESVIALGGGTVLSKKNVELLQKSGQMVYLEAGAETLKRRILKEDLPAFLNDQEELEELIEQRKEIYEAIEARQVKIDLLEEEHVITALRTLWIELLHPN